jgi:SAM-dependent methyltransferase
MKRAFDHCAADYARYRPAYPAGVFEALAELNAASADGELGLAADVGAGTGIFTRQLAAYGWRVVAVEPGEAMLAQVADGVSDRADDPDILRVCATAEATGLASESLELLIAAQAFHWFNPPYALAEFARVLRPGGVLALLWNNREATRSAFVEAYELLIARYNPAYRREYRQQDWPGKIAACGSFESAAYHRFDHAWSPSADELVGFSRSVSYIRNVLSGVQQPRFEDELRQLARAHFGDENCRIPLGTDMWTARRLSEGRRGAV